MARDSPTDLARVWLEQLPASGGDYSGRRSCATRATTREATLLLRGTS